MGSAIMSISNYDDLDLVLNNDFTINCDFLELTIIDIHFEYTYQDDIEEHFKHNYLIRGLNDEYLQLEAIRYYDELKQNFSSKPIQNILEVFDVESSLSNSTDFSNFFSFGCEIQGTPIRPDLLVLITQMLKDNEDDYEDRKIRVWKEELFDYISEFHNSFENFEKVHFSGLGSIDLDNATHRQIVWDLAVKNWLIPGHLTRSMCENGYMQPNGGLMGKASGSQYKAWSYILKYPFLFTELAKSCNLRKPFISKNTSKDLPQIHEDSKISFLNKDSILPEIIYSHLRKEIISDDSSITKFTNALTGQDYNDKIQLSCNNAMIAALLEELREISIDNGSVFFTDSNIGNGRFFKKYRDGDLTSADIQSARHNSIKMGTYSYRYKPMARDLVSKIVSDYHSKSKKS